VEISKAATLRGKSFDIRSSICRSAERLEVGPAGIVEEDDYKIRRLTGFPRPTDFGQSHRSNSQCGGLKEASGRHRGLHKVLSQNQRTEFRLASCEICLLSSVFCVLSYTNGSQPVAIGLNIPEPGFMSSCFGTKSCLLAFMSHFQLNVRPV